MKNLKWSITGLVLMISPLIKAQDVSVKRTEGKRLMTELNLTDEQQLKVAEIKESYQPKMNTVLQDQSLSDADKRNSVIVLRKEMRKELKDVLTDEQLARQKELKEQRMAVHKNRNMKSDHQKKHKMERKELSADEKASIKTMKLDEMVKLTDDQKTKASAIYKEYIEKKITIVTQDIPADKKKSELEKISKKEKKELNKILKTSQIRSWNEQTALQKEKREKMRKRQHRHCRG